MATIGKVRAVFTANANGLSSGVNQAAGSMRKLTASAASTAKGMRALTMIQGAQLFGSIASGVSNAVSSLLRYGQAEAETIDRTSKLAARLGMTYGELAGIGFAGDLAGVSLDTIAAAATKADVAFVKASNGSKQAGAAFATLGLSMDQLQGMSSADRFEAIADALAGIPDEAQRSAAAVALFGRSGAELLPLFAGGAGSIKAAREEAERFGLTLTNAQGQNVEAMNDSFTRVQKAISGIFQQVTAYLSPAVKAITTQFTDFVGSVGGQNIGTAIGDGILAGARYLATIGDYLIQNFGGVFKYFGDVSGSMSSSFGIGNQVAQAFYGAFKLFEFVGNTIGLLLSDVIGGLLGQIASVADWVPGLQGLADGLQASADYMTQQSAAFKKAADENLAASGKAFATAIFGTAQEAGEKMAGPLTTSLDEAWAKAREALKRDDKTPAAPPVKVEVTGVKEAVKGIDSRSAEGVAEMFRIMRGGDGNLQEQMLEVQREIAANTRGGEDVSPFAIEGA